MQHVSDSTLSSDVAVTPILVHYDDELETVPVCLSNHSVTFAVYRFRALMVMVVWLSVLL